MSPRIMLIAMGKITQVGNKVSDDKDMALGFPLGFNLYLHH
jgi:hypothetical protein